jgi:phosphoenolpyruvate carboxykinase (ATP)
MSVPTIFAIPKKELIKLGLRTARDIHYQLSPEELSAQTIARGEGVLNNTGALVINTGKFTGRSSTLERL